MHKPVTESDHIRKLPFYKRKRVHAFHIFPMQFTLQRNNCIKADGASFISVTSNKIIFKLDTKTYVQIA